MYQIRLVEEKTIVQSSEVVTLDPQKFRNLSIPFEGEDEADFLKYINFVHSSCN